MPSIRPCDFCTLPMVRPTSGRQRVHTGCLRRMAELAKARGDRAEAARCRELLRRRMRPPPAKPWRDLEADRKRELKRRKAEAGHPICADCARVHLTHLEKADCAVRMARSGQAAAWARGRAFR